MKHGNKYWEREKEYISLLRKYNYIYSTAPRYRWRVKPNSEIDEVKNKLVNKFYNEYHGKYNTAPKWYRKMMNRQQRAKSKQTLIKELKGYDVCYEDNYRGCSWYW